MEELDSIATRIDTGVRSVARAVDVLALFDEDHPTRTLRDLVSRTGLPKTTVVRMLTTLEGLGLVVGSADTGYTLGSVFLRWVALAQTLWEVGPECRRLMTQLVDTCGETVNLYVRRDTQRIAIAQVEGTSTVRSVVKVGVPYDLAFGAAAKILLGGAPEAVVRKLARRRKDASPVALEREISAIAAAGYAVTHGEREFGASAVAAPIFGADGRVVAALSVSGPTSRYTPDRVGGYVDAVIETAAAITGVGLGSVEAFL